MSNGLWTPSRKRSPLECTVSAGVGRDGGGALPRLEKRRFSGDQRTSDRHDPRAGRGGRPLPSGVSYRRLRDPVHNGEPVQGRNGKAPHVWCATRQGDSEK